MAAWWQKSISLSNQSIGVSPQASGISLVRVAQGIKGLRLEEQHWLESAAAIGDLLKRRAWRKLPIHSLLPADQYSILQLARPEVPDAELASALRWVLPDMVDIPANELSFEPFERPASARSGAVRQIHVAVCRKTLITEQLQQFAFGERLQSLGIRELALRNLLQAWPQIPSSFACLLRLPEGLFLLIVKDQALFLFRSLQTIDWAQMEQTLATGDVYLVERLLLELQRSLDFYDDQLASSPLAHLLVMPAMAESAPVMDYLQHHLSMQCQALTLADVLELPQPLSLAQQQPLLTSIGAVLRGGD